MPIAHTDLELNVKIQLTDQYALVYLLVALVLALMRLDQHAGLWVLGVCARGLRQARQWVSLDGSSLTRFVMVLRLEKLRDNGQRAIHAPAQRYAHCGPCECDQYWAGCAASAATRTYLICRRTVMR